MIDPFTLPRDPATGWKWSIATDRNGIPVGWEQAGVNSNDCVLLAATLDAVDARGLFADAGTLPLDRGYDNSNARDVCAELGLNDLVATKKRKPGGAKTKKPVSQGAALARRAHELVDVELRALCRNTDRFIHHRLDQIALASPS